jgi:hypothetical protein
MHWSAGITGAGATPPDRDGSGFTRAPLGGLPRNALFAQPPGLTGMPAVQITRFGGPEVLDIVDVPEPTPGPGQRRPTGTVAAR